jgi:hypothetical protein
MSLQPHESCSITSITLPIHVSAGSHHAVTPLAQGFAQVRGELAFPLPHGFMRKDEAPLEEHLRQVPQAQFAAETPEDHQAHDIRRLLETIEWRSWVFIAHTFAVTTAAPAIAEGGPIRAFGGGGRLTVRARHMPPPLQEECTGSALGNQGGVKADRTSSPTSVPSCYVCSPNSATAVLPTSPKSPRPIPIARPYRSPGVSLIGSSW